jgi:hypothetical protein
VLSRLAARLQSRGLLKQFTEKIASHFDSALRLAAQR